MHAVPFMTSHSSDHPPSKAMHFAHPPTCRRGRRQSRPCGRLRGRAGRPAARRGPAGRRRPHRCAARLQGQGRSRQGGSRAGGQVSHHNATLASMDSKPLPGARSHQLPTCAHGQRPLVEVDQEGGLVAEGAGQRLQQGQRAGQRRLRRRLRRKQKGRRGTGRATVRTERQAGRGKQAQHRQAGRCRRAGAGGQVQAGRYRHK
jgi:hypothetical protein